MSAVPLRPTLTPWEVYAEAAARTTEGLKGRILKTDVWNELRGEPGPGGIVPHLPPECQVSMVDIDGDAIERLRSTPSEWPPWPNQNVSLLKADIRALPFQKDCFDAVIDCSTLDHVQNYPIALAEYRRVLKPGGRLLLFCWATDQTQTSFRSPDQWYFALGELRSVVADLFEETSAEIAESKWWNGTLGPHTFMMQFTCERRDADAHGNV